MAAAAEAGAEGTAVEYFVRSDRYLALIITHLADNKADYAASTLPGIPAISSQSFSIAPASCIILRVTVAATTLPSKKYLSPESMLPSSVMRARDT